MSRNNIIEEITLKDLEQQISLYDIISRYTSLKLKGNKYIGLCCKHKEKTPSFSIDINKNIFKCFGCGLGGNNIVSFIMQMESCDYKQAINIIKNNYYNPNILKKSIIYNKKEIEETVIKFVDGKWTDKHLEYWKFLEEDYKWLESKNIFAVKDWAMGTKSKMSKIRPTKNEITFAYYAPDIDKCKILRIGKEIQEADKWRNTVPNDYLWYYNDYNNKECNEGFIVKSVKDCVLLHKLGRCAIAVQNESAKILLDNNLGKVSNLFKNPIILYGTDNQGKQESIEITKKTGWKWFNIENHLYNQFGIEDPTDYIKEGGFTLKQLDNKLKEKGF